MRKIGLLSMAGILVLMGACAHLPGDPLKPQAPEDIEAVAKANNTPYGLSAGIWTEKGSRILWMADQLKAGVVWANTFNKFDPASPFGGYKESGYGREGGRHGLSAYVTTGATK